MITKIPLDSSNRLIRIGFGRHNGKWFARVDLWWAAFRFSRN